MTWFFKQFQHSKGHMRSNDLYIFPQCLCSMNLDPVFPLADFFHFLKKVILCLITTPWLESSRGMLYRVRLMMSSATALKKEKKQNIPVSPLRSRYSGAIIFILWKILGGCGVGGGNSLTMENCCHQSGFTSVWCPLMDS